MQLIFVKTIKVGYHLGAVSWAEFCAEDRVTPGVYASSVNMRQLVMETLDSNV